MASRTRLRRDRRLLDHRGDGVTWGDAHLLPVPAPSLDALPTMTTTSPDGFRGAVTIGRRVALRGCLGAANLLCHGTRIVRAGQEQADRVQRTRGALGAPALVAIRAIDVIHGEGIENGATHGGVDEVLTHGRGEGEVVVGPLAGQHDLADTVFRAFHGRP